MSEHSTTSFVRFTLCVAVFTVGGCGEPAHRPANGDGSDSPGRDPSVVGSGERQHRAKCPRGELRFDNVIDGTGIDFRRYDDIRGQHRILESLGGGVAVFDYDVDGRPDLYFPNGCRLPRKLDDRTHPGALYRNRGGMQFSSSTRASSLVNYGFCHGCAVADYNADGFADLYITALGINTLWQNNGDGTFSREVLLKENMRPRWSSSAAWLDVNSDGVLDLYVANYLKTSDDPPRLCPEPGSPDGYVQCAPEMFDASPDVLWLGDGQGGFEDVTDEAGVNSLDGKGLGVVAFDANRDTRPDIYVANDGTPNHLYLNDTPAPVGQQRIRPRFQESATLWGAGLNRHGAPEASMGVACGDYNCDGWPDLFLTHFYRETHTLYRHRQGEGFRDATAGSGLARPSRLVLGFGTVFVDADNDGWLDLFVANGHIDDRRWAGQPYAMPAQLFYNDHGKRFRDASPWAGPYFRRPVLGRGVAAGDLDGDSRTDLVVSQQRGRPAILRNTTNTAGRCVVLYLVGRAPSNRSAIASRVEARGLGPSLVRGIVGGGSFQSARSPAVHIGLGEETVVPQLHIRWPSGRTQQHENVRTGRYIVVEGRPLLSL